jgi:hypothetical protein
MAQPPPVTPIKRVYLPVIQQDPWQKSNVPGLLI